MQLTKDHRLNIALYALASLGCAIAVGTGRQGLEYFCKPAMMLILSSWFFFNSRRFGDRFTLLIQAGLFFSLIGDIALMFADVDHFNFIIGLGAFLIAHLCYAMAFISNITATEGDGWVLGAGVAALIVLYAVFFALDLVPVLDETMVLPVVAYVCVIAFMGVTAAFRHTRTFPRSFWLVMVGALLFMASDSLLATNRFVRPLSWAPVTIIITYAAAQLLIAFGALVHVLDPDTILRRRALEA